MEQEKLLRGATAWQLKNRYSPKRLGEEAQKYINAGKRTFEKNSSVIDAFQQSLPQQLSEHCKVVKISGGTVHVQVEPGPYMHEMQLLSDELLEHIKGRCPYSGIKKIRLLPKGTENESA